MCVILIGKITPELHQAALAQNRDGFSLFTKEQGLVKCPTKKQVEQAFNEFGIWHYRIATSGKVDKFNVHPFEVCGGKYYMYHNGVLGSGKDNRSDTHALADTLYEVGPQSVDTTLQALSEGQRFVLVDSTDPRKYRIYGKWSAEAGVLMSHKLWGIGTNWDRFVTPKKGAK